MCCSGDHARGAQAGRLAGKQPRPVYPRGRSPREDPAIFPPSGILQDVPTFEAFFQQPRLGVDMIGELDDSRIRETIQMLMARQRRTGRAGEEEEEEAGEGEQRKYLGVVLPHVGADEEDVSQWLRVAIEVSVSG